MPPTTLQPARFEDLHHLPGSLPDHFVIGVDVSHHDGPLNWARLRQQGIEFAYIKVTEGVNARDHMAQSHALAARAAGLRIGFYHFCHPSPASDTAAIIADAKSEARDFINALESLPLADLPPVIDLETDEPQTPGSSADFLKWVQQLLEELRDPSAVLPYPILYSRAEYLNRHLPANHTLGSICPLWLARYSANYQDAQPARGWGDWVIWQFTEEGRILPSGLLDLNVWRRSDYLALIERLA